MGSERGRRSRQRSHDLGVRAEQWVASLLVQRGARILASRWQGRGGEVDLIVERDGVLRFVEVKARTDPHDDGLLSISRSKQRKIAAAAASYLDAHRIEAEDLGFLVALVHTHEEPWTVTWLDDAFDALDG